MHKVARTMGAAALGLALVAGAGCGKAAEKAAERAVEESVEGDGEVDISDDGVKVETEDGSVEIDAEGGSLPEDWPDDVPVPDDLSIQYSASTGSGDEQVVNVTGATELSADEVVELYKDELSDWDVESESASSSGGGSFTTIAFVDGDRHVTVGVNESDGTTNLTLAYRLQPSS